MATSDSKSCVICTNDFNASVRWPVALPCGHNFCLTCTVRLKASNSADCPHCRKSFAEFDLPDLPSMAEASKDTSDDGEFVGCLTHRHPFFYWSVTQKVFYCRYCILEINIQVSELKDIGDAIPLIRSELESKATSASEGLHYDMEKHKEEREKAVGELEKTERFERKIQRHISEFQQFIQEVDSHNSRLRQKSALVEEITRDIQEIKSEDDMAVILRYWGTLKELQRTARVPHMTRPAEVLNDIVQEFREAEERENPARANNLQVACIGGPFPNNPVRDARKASKGRK